MLTDRRTVAWKARLTSASGMQEDKVFCVKASWAQEEGKHEGRYIKQPHDTQMKNVVKLLVFRPEKSCDGYGKRVVVGVCDLWPVARPSQNRRRRARSLINR